MKTVEAKDVQEGDYLPDERAAVAEVTFTGTIRKRVILTLTNESALVLKLTHEVAIL